MSIKASGLWASEFCAYTDAKGPVIASHSGNNDPVHDGYQNYLSFSIDGVKFQHGPIMKGVENVTIHDVPRDVAEAAVKAAIGVVIGHLLANGAKL